MNTLNIKLTDKEKRLFLDCLDTAGAYVDPDSKLDDYKTGKKQQLAIWVLTEKINKSFSEGGEKLDSALSPIISCSNCNSKRISHEKVIRCKDCNSFHDHSGMQL